MSEAKFTPGPWRYVNGVQICSTKDPIAKVWMMRNGEGKANAHLIAAAPELYAVVEKLAKWNKYYPSTRVYGYGDIKQIAEEMDAINAQAISALAKARGEIND